MNNLIDFYRQKHEGGCTTRDRISLDLFINGRKVRTESYQDGTCSVDYLADAGPQDLARLPFFKDKAPRPVLSIEAVRTTAETAYKRKIPLVPYHDIPRQQTRAYEKAEQNAAEERENQEARNTLKQLPGAAVALRRFHLADVSRGYFGTEGDSILADLKAPASAPIDHWEWYVPVKDKDQPHQDWNQALRVHDTIARLIQARPWIAQWRAAVPARSVYVRVLGAAPDFDKQDRDEAAKAWHHAGLRGEPYCEILLYRNVSSKDGGNTFIVAVLGKEEGRTLITSADLPVSTAGQVTPVDRLPELFYWHKDRVPKYYVVSLTGIPTRNKRPW